MRTLAPPFHETADSMAYIRVKVLDIFLAVLGFNLLGDALRDVLEPRLRGAQATARLQSR